MLSILENTKENTQVNHMKMALWIDSKGPLAFTVSDGWWVISAHVEQLKDLQNHPI